ncbi:hypothetical protein BT67DRAFT_421194 [Trichocladium antarcticum]|uniref:Uncharacterized protein n=1 Tax=Trichocladium antarcticum TaxID=1450529 RepID=A0AAN6ZDQ6_9PEZI|nr:hypothetical protein BT67DRAFT_421194 [Trichocladium antarcticum]
MDTHTYPLFLSPALPSDLINFIIQHCTSPTTLIICSDRAEFLSALTQDTATNPNNPITLHPNPPKTPHHPPVPKPHHPLLTSPIHTLAVARHIRTVFIPTVSHLRAFLSIFPTAAATGNKIPPPPPPTTTTTTTTTTTRKTPLLLVFNFLSLHRHTSEWSVQGLSSTAAALVEAGRRGGLRVVVAEQSGAGRCGGGLQALLGERVPVLSGGARRAAGLELRLQGPEGSGWARRTADVGRVLGRWFRFRDGEWGEVMGKRGS